MEASRRRSLVGINRNKDDEDVAAADEEFDDVEVWDTLSNGFKRAELVLDQNRDLIQRVNDNHRSRIPDNVAVEHKNNHNISLIYEINVNISIVTEIYYDLSVDFTKMRGRTAKNGDTITTTTTGS